MHTKHDEEDHARVDSLRLFGGLDLLRLLNGDT
jgi:hypothetical protein